jgi:LysM repeat protein
MANRNKNMILVSLLVLTAIIISACTQPYSNVPLETPTANPTNLFVSPIATTDNPMDMIGEFATSTAMAETAAAGGLPVGTEAPGIEITPDSNVSATPDTTSPVVATATPTISVASPTAKQPLPTVTTNRPGSYTLQKGEFPYCIARRFNIDPSALLNANNLASGDVYYPNLTLTIPQSGGPFPGTRALNSRPATYTVPSSDTTLYSVACHYGDIDPASIAQANNLQLTASLTVGQQLTIP